MEIITDSIKDVSLLDRLSAAFEQFPASTPESTMLYNYIKLQQILQKKEMQAFTDDTGLIERAITLSAQSGQAVKVLQTDTEEGLRMYEEAAKRMEDELPGYVYLFAKQWAQSVKALYYYKRKEFRQAFALTLECLTLNECLVREGVGTLIFRCAEQNRNLSRVLLKMGEGDKGTALAGNLFKYLVNGDGQGLYGTVFREEQFWSAIPYIREGFTYEYFRGLVSVLVKENPFDQEKKKKLFYQLFGGITFEVTTPDRQAMYNWLFMKNLFYEEHYAEFIESFTEFMQEELSQVYDVLKISLFQDVTYLIQKWSFNDDGHLMQKIKHHLDNKLKLFNTLRADVSRSEYGSNDFPLAFPGA